MEHKGWNRRGYLPHCDYAGNLQAITFRLADSLPENALGKWRCEFERDLNSGDPQIQRAAQTVLHRRVTEFEDAGHGSCILREHGGIVQQLLIEGHAVSYRLIEWCIMPNHVHVLLKEIEGRPLSQIVQRWKGSSSAQINKLTNRGGRLWMPDYHDRLIRDEDHYFNARAYIRNNPVKAKLCKQPEDWPWSSCGIGWNPDQPT